MLVLYSKAFLKATSAACKRPFCVKTLPKFPKAENKKKNTGWVYIILRTPCILHYVNTEDTAAQPQEGYDSAKKG